MPSQKHHKNITKTQIAAKRLYSRLFKINHLCKGHVHVNHILSFWVIKQAKTTK